MEVAERIRLLDAAFEKAKKAEYSTALEDFEFLEAQSTHPQDIAALHLFQASCLTDLGKATDALNRIRTVDAGHLGFANLIVFEFEYARIMRALGERENALKRIQNALKAVDSADDKDSTEIVARNLRTLWGIVLAELGRCDEAIVVLEQVPVEDEGWADAKFHLGDCKYKKKQYRDAIHNYQDVVSCRSGNGPFLSRAALRNIGYAFFDLEEYTDAIKYLTKVEDQYDAYPEMKKELFSILASAYAHLGKIDEAQKYRHPPDSSQLLQ